MDDDTYKLKDLRSFSQAVMSGVCHAFAFWSVRVSLSWWRHLFLPSSNRMGEWLSQRQPGRIGVSYGPRLLQFVRASNADTPEKILQHMGKYPVLNSSPQTLSLDRRLDALGFCRF